MEENNNEQVYDAEPINDSSAKQETTYTVNSESNGTAKVGYQAPEGTEPSDPFNIASLVCGILGLLGSCFIGLRIVALILDILAIIFGVKATDKPGAKLGKAGKICGIVGLCLWILFAILIMSVLRWILTVVGVGIGEIVESLN